jgi:acyl-CoA synthetase (NDP forming)
VKGAWLPTADVYAVLNAFGIDSATPMLAATAQEAVEAARRIGRPVAMKATGPAVVHKSDIGGIALGLSGDDAVRIAFEDMHRRVGAAMTGVMIQPMVTGGVELLVGATFDPTFGPVMACGLGGTLVELFSDVVVRLPPLTDVDALEMVNAMRGAPLLRGYRGGAVMDEAALRNVLLRVSALVDACPGILELDINPLQVLPNGACALDARIRVGLIAIPRSRRVTY